MTRDSRADEAERYRSAAEESLHQLEWCVHYLYGIRKREIAAAIDKNRRFIQERMTREDDS